MSATNNNGSIDPETADLAGLRILLVEDSWNVGVAMKRLLQVLGASIAGPVATTADAERLMSEQMPDVGLVDFSLRNGELAHGLIDKLNGHGVPVIVISGYTDVPLRPGTAALALQKPVVKSQLLSALRSVTAPKSPSS
jgi:CheY-like chemotaxis protein